MTVNKALDKIKKVVGIEQFYHTKILIDTNGLNCEIILL